MFICTVQTTYLFKPVVDSYVQLSPISVNTIQRLGKKNTREACSATLLGKGLSLGCLFNVCSKQLAKQILPWCGEMSRILGDDGRYHRCTGYPVRRTGDAVPLLVEQCTLGRTHPSPRRRCCGGFELRFKAGAGLRFL